MYGSPADARRQPSPPGARHGQGRPLGQPGVARAIARTIFSYVGWSQDRPAASPLPPLSPSAADDDTVTGPSVGASPRQPVDIEDDSAQSNGAISINHTGCDREKVFLDFLDLARAQRGLFRLFSQQGAQNGPRPPCYAYCRSRGGCRPSATAEVWLRRASVRPPD